MTKEKFDAIYQRAAERKGGEVELEARLSQVLTDQELVLLPDDRWLAVMTQKVFQCGITWQVVRNKWPGFEEVFWGFDIEKMLLIPTDMWESKAQDTKIIRHLGKVMTIPANAEMIYQAQKTHGSFAQLVAQWPSEDIIGLWQYMKTKGKRLGGNTGPYALRQMGKETFLLTGDVEAYLRNTGIVDSGKNTKRALTATQAAFNDWQQESGRSLTQISQIIAFSAGDNRI
ncbi:DNA-3-methyladenine glycosylase I [Vibrio sp. Of7-15]|uniref:DNA-3-methyladenine glycosylase I n=1 Tax=Vibrio sp. Of7-15 TaxID=2724879 RepID=UPI001EF33C70|nr:DNA-3-methyladenine glycosylase I [Vibrio sp. Of7-15]MCG7498352.1 DNA-3-methyladenine glycosylase I [Vibrio sp. Of7-15]